MRPFLTVLGIAQDAGVPHVGCECDRCTRAWEEPVARRRVAALGLVDPPSATAWMLDATPDFPGQLRDLTRPGRARGSWALGGIFLTHAHIGHYAGLMYLGREGLGAREVPVYCLPRMMTFLEENGPWDQLIALRNIRPKPLVPDGPVALEGGLKVTPWIVPHRDEYSETAGFLIEGGERRALFLPDIDGWEAWAAAGRRIEEVLEVVDVAYLDGTFFDERELGGARRGEIPHPTLSESLERFSSLPIGVKEKIRFIHLNHSNPALERGSAEREAVAASGMALAEEGEVFEL